MVFKNQKELERFVMKQSRLAIVKAQEEVYKIIKQFLYKFYGEYHPDVYQRTRQLLESLVQTQIVSDGKGYKAEVYFDLDGIRYETGRHPSGEQVMDAANQGYHGAIGDIPDSNKQFKYVDIGGGTRVWDDPKKVLDARAIDILVNMLKAEGIPVKRG